MFAFVHRFLPRREETRVPSDRPSEANYMFREGNVAVYLTLHSGETFDRIENGKGREQGICSQ